MSAVHRITVDVRMLNSSGIGTYIQNLLPRIMSARAQDRFVLMGDPDHIQVHAWSRADNVQILPCRVPVYSAVEQWQIPMHTPAPTDLFWTPHYNVPVLYRGKLVVTVHDLFHLAMPEFVPGVHRRLYARLMFQAVRRRASLVLTDSQFTANEFTRLVGRGRSALRTIHLGVDESWSRVTPTKRPHHDRFVLFVGNVKRNKNLVTLLRAFESIHHLIPHHLVIVGRRDGLLIGDPSVGPAAAALSGRVHFTGQIATSLLEQYVAFADALVHPSLYEGFGLPPLEAMACGCPVIVSHAASLPEVCGDAALYCDPHSEADVAARILQLLSDQELRETLRHRGRRRAASFTWSRCADETLDAMDWVLAS